MNLLSLLGIDRWVSSLSDQMHETMVEAVSGFDARAELAKQEWVEEKQRLGRVVFWSCLCLGFATALLFAVSIAVVVTFWDSSYRTLAAWSVVGVWFLGMLVSLLVLRALMKRGQASFEYTKRELGRDWQALKDQF